MLEIYNVLGVLYSFIIISCTYMSKFHYNILYIQNTDAHYFVRTENYSFFFL